MRRRCWVPETAFLQRHSCSCTPSRSWIWPIRHGLGRRLPLPNSSLLSPFKHGAVDYADVILPVAPFTETAGTFVNCEGRAQEFTAVVLPLGLARPAWKVL